MPYSSASACGASAAGARDVRRIPSSCTFSTSGQKRVSPSRPRTASSDSSRSKETRSSRTWSGSWPRPCLHQTLALSVVAEPAGLQERREGLHLVVDAGGRDPEPAEELLLDEPVLRRLERGGTRDRAHAPRRLDRDVLELVGDGRRAVREPVEQLRIVVGADEQLPHLAGRRVGGRIEEPEREPERDPGEREHPPELTAPDDADDRQVTDCYLAGSGFASTASVCSAR